MARLATVLVAVTGLALLACGTGSSTAAPKATAAATMPAAASTPASAAATPAASGAQGTRRMIGQMTFVDRGTVNATTRTEVPIALENFAFSPTFVQGKPGEKVKLELSNTSTAPHNLSIEVQSIDRDVAPGAQATVEVTIPQSGAVLFFCKLHTGQGMNGELLAGTIEPQAVGTPGAKTDAASDGY